MMTKEVVNMLKKKTQAFWLRGNWDLLFWLFDKG